MRPISRQKKDRVPAHILVASLALLVDRAREKRLQSAGLDLSSLQAWQAFKTVRGVKINLGNGERKQSVARTRAQAAGIRRTLGINDLAPRAGATTPCA